MANDVIGAVLAGGRGRRIGADKPSLDVGGQTLARRAVDTLKAAGLDCVLVLRRDQPVPLTAHTLGAVRDEVEDAGPLGGLQAVLRWLPAEWALVIACDQPLIRPELLRGLLAQRAEDLDAVAGHPNGLAEPLPGLYRRTCLPAVEAALRRGERGLRDLLSSVRLCAVPADALRAHDPLLLSYVNVNTPEDLTRVRRLAEDGRHCATPAPKANLLKEEVRDAWSLRGRRRPPH